MRGGRAAATGLVLVAAASALRAQHDPHRWARVIAVAPSGATIDAGSSRGLRTWTRVEIVRGGRPVAVLKVVTLATRQATCALTSRPIPLRLGDSARFLPSEAPASRVGKNSPAPTPRAVRPPPPPPPAPARATVPARDTQARAPAVTPSPSLTPVPPPVERAQATPPTPAPAPSSHPPDAEGRGAPAGHTMTARVTFLTTSSAYVSAGRKDGLEEGSTLEVVRHGRAIARLEAKFLSSHQSACRIVTASDSIAVGDTVRFTPVASAAVATAGGGGAARAVSRTPPAPRSGGAPQLRGRIGLYYLAVIQRDSLGGQFSQPSGDLRLNGNGLGGSPLGLVLDVRVRRSVGSIGGNTAVQTRVYQALAYWQASGSPLRFTTGRQYAPGIASVGLVDGAALELSRPSVDYGLFGGTQPALANLGYSSDISQLGGYVRVHSRQGSARHWGMTVGASGSYVAWHANREFLSVQADYFSPRLSFYAVQEVDYYRPWRRVGGESAVSPTSTFANLLIQVTPGFSVSGGVDNRRNVRLYQDVVDSTAAAIFDESFRRGVWAGLAVRTPRHFRASFDVRASHDRTTGSADTYTLGLGAERLTPLGLSLRTRSTRYTTPLRQGWLNSASLGFAPLGRGNLTVTSGWRTERDTSAATRNIRWLSVDGDLSLARRVFLILSLYRETGGLEAHDLVYTGLNMRF